MKKEEILAICIDKVQSGESTVEECVARYPKLGKELRSLLEIAARLKPDEVTPSLEFKQRARRHLLEKMHPVPTRVSHSLWSWPKLAPARWLAFVLIGVLVFSLAGVSTVYAAQRSLPGDLLYPVKIGVEDLHMAVTWDAVDKANLHLENAQRRIDEATQLAEQNRTVDAQALATVEKQFDDAIKELSSSSNTLATGNVLSNLSVATLNQQVELEQVLNNAPEDSKSALKRAFEVTRRGSIIAQVAYVNHDYLKRHPSVSNDKLEVSQFKIDGILLSIEGHTWNVGGVIIDNVHSSERIPTIGSWVTLEGLVDGDEVFVSRIEVRESSQKSTHVAGQFGGTNEDGSAAVGGISVKLSDDDVTELEPGDSVHLHGDDDDDTLHVTRRESYHDGSWDGSTVRGILMATDTEHGTIIVKMAGSQTTVNIGEASIENEAGRTLHLSDLNHLIGETVKLGGLYKEGDHLFARRIRVEVEE